MLSAIKRWTNYNQQYLNGLQATEAIETCHDCKPTDRDSDLDLLLAIKRWKNYNLEGAIEACHDYKPTDHNSDLEMLSAIKRWTNYNQQYLNVVDECQALKTFSPNENDLIKMEGEVLAWHKGRDLFVPVAGHNYNTVDDDLEMLSAIQAWSDYKPKDHDSDVEMLLAIEAWRDYDHFEQEMTSLQATTKLVNLWQALKTFCAIDLIEMEVLN